MPKESLSIGQVINKKLFDSAADGLDLVLVVFEVGDQEVQRNIIKNRSTGRVLHNLLRVMKSQQQRSERLNSYLAKAEGTFSSDEGVGLFGNTFDEQKLSMGPKVLNA